MLHTFYIICNAKSISANNNFSEFLYYSSHTTNNFLVNTDYLSIL